METVPLTIVDAEAFLRQHERHYVEPGEKICAIGLGEFIADGGGIGGGPETVRMELHGAAILGRNADGDGMLAHIYVDGTFQGYSILYGACWRALKALGYKKAWL